MLYKSLLESIKTKVKSYLDNPFLNLQHHTHKSYFDIINEISLKETLKQIGLNIEKNSFASFSTVTVSIDDAVLNTLAYTCNNKHTRFYTLEEILSSKKENTELYMYLSFKEQVFLKDIIENNKNKEKDIIAQMKNIPENVAEYMNFHYDDRKNLESFNITISTFIFKII